MPTTQSDARRFFVDRIVAQAAREGAPLSEDERQMLHWSESAPDSVADPALAERLAKQISDADYEARIAGLIERRYAVDVAADAAAKTPWKEAWSALGKGDHYLLVMIERAIGRRVKPWWRFW